MFKATIWYTCTVTGWFSRHSLSTHTSRLYVEVIVISAFLGTKDRKKRKYIPADQFLDPKYPKNSFLKVKIGPQLTSVLLEKYKKKIVSIRIQNQAAKTIVLGLPYISIHLAKTDSRFYWVYFLSKPIYMYFIIYIKIISCLSRLWSFSGKFQNDSSEQKINVVH